MEIAEKNNLYVIEDCAQAYFAEYRGKRAGTIGHFGCFSMQQSKHMTAGDGGLTITNDEKLARRAKLFSDKGWQRPVYCDWLFLAPNYRMTELQAAVGLAQLGKVDSMVDNRIWTGQLLMKLLDEVSGILNSSILPDVKHTFWQFGFLIDRTKISIPVEDFGKALEAEGIPCLPAYTRAPMYLYPLFRNKNTYGKSGFPFNSPYVRKDLKYEEGMCPVAEKVINDIVVLPWSERYKEEDVQDIKKGIQKVSEFYSNEK
jgi:dTDP-4-amino-4,6-dideoxygalactose transaminase